ncbi:MAG: hypothetical protein ABWY06_02430 [Pseudomonas sp.]|uniref:hypothetical protein n=1 Tax=Pseudomonas sp. TaxID=306 RepID=UPI00339289C6
MAWVIGWSASAGAAEVTTAIAKFYPGAKVMSEPSGSIVANGGRYHAALIQRAGVPPGPELLVVVKETESGALSEVINSESFDVGGRTVTLVEMRNSSIYLTLHGSAGCCGHSGRTYQFRLAGERFVLIGEEEISVDFSDKGGARRFYENRRSINFLTGTAVFSGRIGSADRALQAGNGHYPEWMPYRIARADAREEHTTRFTANRRWTLEEFDLYAFGKWTLEVKDLCGFFDDALLFKSCTPLIEMR